MTENKTSIESAGAPPEVSAASHPGHSFYFDSDLLIVEWYDHGPDVPYESANMLAFNLGQQALLAEYLEIDAANRSGQSFLAAVQRHLQTYFEVKAFCEEKGISFSRSVDFMP